MLLIISILAFNISSLLASEFISLNHGDVQKSSLEYFLRGQVDSWGTVEVKSIKQSLDLADHVGSRMWQWRDGPVGLYILTYIANNKITVTCDFNLTMEKEELWLRKCSSDQVDVRCSSHDLRLQNALSQK